MIPSNEYTTLEHHWMPFSSNYAFKKSPRMVVRGEGAYYWSDAGARILDGCSGLFCVALGHCRQEIADAVYRQMTTLDYASPFQSAHPGPFALAERLAPLLPEGINHVFFGNSGSEAVDTAIKMAVAYHRAKGQPQRTHLVSRQRAYHGANIGGTSLSGIVKNRQTFEGITLKVQHLRDTASGQEKFTMGQPEHGAELADDLHHIANTIGGENISACFVEPIAGSSGILVPPVGYLQRLREICDEYGILLVFDEVITGFGRTGYPFASDAFEVVPDIMTMAKAITNAAQPMGAVALKDEIYEGVVNEPKGKGIEFFHGYTYSGHPAACAAGLATLDLFQQENVFAQAARLAPYFQEKIFSLRDLSVVSDIRGYGLLAGIDLKPQGSPGLAGLEGTEKLFQAGLHVKFTGDCALLAPPLVCDPSHIDQIVDIFRSVYR